MLEFSMQLHITTPKWLEKLATTTTLFSQDHTRPTEAHLRIHVRSHDIHPGRWSLMGTNGSTPETRKTLKKHADCDLLHRVDSYNLTTSNNNTCISKSCKHSDQLQYYCSGINCCRISVQYSTTCSFTFL